ncbi:MAG: transposase [Peptostreptococcaceae bacterium]|nr:transposase [Peptostreptococcaceae bacterium]
MSKNDVRFTDEFEKQIVELYRSGQSVNQLSSEYGVSNISIYK